MFRLNILSNQVSLPPSITATPTQPPNGYRQNPTVSQAFHEFGAFSWLQLDTKDKDTVSIIAHT